MAPQEKQNLISLFTLLTVGIPYIAYIFIRFQDENLNTIEEIKYWATAILLMIPIRIIGYVITYILFVIAKAIITQEEPKEDGTVDERDKLIELKSDRNAHYIFIIGFMLAFLAFIIDESVAAMFTIIIISGVLSEIFGIISKICYYRGGL